jgi:hypothetical protein
MATSLCERLALKLGSTAIRSILTPVSLLCVMTFSPAARADLLYDFSYVATSGSVHSFHIFVTSPSFITGGSPPFATVNVTDGTTIWPLTMSTSGEGAFGGCFTFGTELAVLFSPPNGCGFAIPQTIDAPIGAVFFEFSGGLPTATGVYTPTPGFGGSHVWGEVSLPIQG